MIFTVVAVRDRAVDGFAAPFFVPSEGVAIRSFADEVNRAGSPINAHPEDYDLFVLGLWHDQDARFECASPRQIAIGKSLLSPPVGSVG